MAAPSPRPPARRGAGAAGGRRAAAPQGGARARALCLLAALGAAGAARPRAPPARGLRGLAEAPAAGLGAPASGLDDGLVDAMVGLNSSRQRRSRRAAGHGGEPGWDLEEAIHEGAAKMDLDTALQGVRAAQPPPEVLATLSHIGTVKGGALGAGGVAAGSGAGAGEEDAKHAVAVLNEMVLKAQERLGNKSIECKEFQEDSMRDIDRIKADLAQMGMERANLNRMMTASMGAIVAANSNAQSAKERLSTQEIHYKEQLAKDQLELDARIRDLDAATFMLDLTACGSLLQGSGSGAGAADGLRSSGYHATSAVKICKNASGVTDVRFKDVRLQNASGELSPDGRRILYLALARDQKLREGRGLDDDEPGLALLSASAALAAVPVDAEKQAQKCVQAESGCGPLHDTFGTLWTDMKELVDDTRVQIQEDTDTFTHFSEAINNQLKSITASIKEQQGALQAATTAGGTLASRQAELVGELDSLEKMSWNKQTECKTTIREILYKQICAVHKVRDELIRLKLSDVNLAEVSDCYLTDFLASSCSKSCDDDLVGGEMNMTRDVITKNSEYGAPCPALRVTHPCNRKRCPIDCRVSEWSAWSKCTSDCGGGVQSRVRQLEQKPRYDGQACNTLQDTQVCNTGACDRDCTLGEWSGWSPCDMACNSGFRRRTREVAVPAIGKGVCPSEDDAARLERMPCNTEPCVGDETCVGELDIVLAIDGSGSLGEEGFAAMRTFAGKFVERLKPQAYGHDAVQAGAVLFGNGMLDKDKVMSDAIMVSALTTDMAKLKESIDALEWQRGMTNMAQAIHKANNVVKTGARMNAQTVVILITDGRMAFKSQVAKAVEDIRKSARLIVVHVQSHPLVDYVNLLKGFASRPWMTNYMLVRGRALLSVDYATPVSTLVARTCKKVVSPSAASTRATTQGFALELEGYSCGDSTVSSMQRSPADCLAAAYEASPDFKAFAFGGKPGPAPGTVVKAGVPLTADATPFFVYRCDVYAEDCTADNAHKNETHDVYKRVDVSA